MMQTRENVTAMPSDAAAPLAFTGLTTALQERLGHHASRLAIFPAITAVSER